MLDKFCLQGGDYEFGDGRGGESIYGPYFDDENFAMPNNVGNLTMANSGKNKNASQFFLLTAPQPHLDGKHVVCTQFAHKSTTSSPFFLRLLEL